MIEIREVNNKKEIRRFLKFTEKHYKDNGNKIIETKGTINTLIIGVNKLNSKLLFIIIGKLARKEIIDINTAVKRQRI